MRLNKYQKLFTKWKLDLTEEMYDDFDDELKDVFKSHKVDLNTILTMISTVMLIYNILDSSMGMSESEVKRTYDKFDSSINEIFKEQGKVEVDKVKNIMSDAAFKTYNANNYLFDIGYKTNYEVKDTFKFLDKIINETIKGKNYSDRIWDNKNKVAASLKKDIMDFLEGKTSVNKIKKIISDKFNSNSYNTRRLVVTEISRVQVKANEQWEVDNNIQYVMYMATLDSKTCTDCEPYDGWVGVRSNKPVELPQHPLCRCLYSPIPDINYRPKTRMDNETKTHKPYQTYKEWISDNTE